MNEELKSRIQAAAVVGAGGAGFPSYAKLSPGADTLIINASECEPLLETDYMLMREHMDKILDGAQIIMECADIGTQGVEKPLRHPHSGTGGGGRRGC